MNKLYSHFKSFSFLFLMSSVAAEGMNEKSITNQQQNEQSFMGQLNNMSKITTTATLPSSIKYQKDTKLSPITISQAYYYLSNELLSEIAQQIFSFQFPMYNINFTDFIVFIKNNNKKPSNLVYSIHELINSCGYDLATELFTYALSHAKMSINDIKDNINWTMLHSATCNGLIDVVRLILQVAGDKVWIPLTMQDKVNDWTPSHYAAEGGHVKISELFLKAAGEKAWTLIAEVKKSQTVLHIAVRSKCPDITKLIINAVGDKSWMLLSAKDQVNGGETALHCAAEKGNVEVVELLLERAGDHAQTFIAMLKGNSTVLDVATPGVKEIMKKYF